MIPKYVRGAWLLALAMFIAPLAQAENAANPESVIREFYQWYVQSMAANRSPLTDEGPKLKRYATSGMLRRIDKLSKNQELGADPFLQAQDVDKAWAKNIKVSNSKTTGKVATANVELKGSEMTQKLAVTLRQESGAWKIDKVDPK
jgi:hypothetical protein